MLYLGLVSILVILFSFSVFSARKMKGKSYSGKKSAGLPLIIGAVVGTLVGGSSTIGTSQSAFSGGLVGWWYTIGCALGIVIFGLFFSRRIYDTECATIPEIIASRYGKTSGVTMSLMASLGTLIGLVAQVLSGTALITSFLPISTFWALLLFMVLVVLYVFFGGGVSLGYMGILKTILLFLGIGICGIVAFVSLDKGALQTLPKDYFNIFSGGVAKNLSTTLSVIAGIVTGQNYVSAVITAKNRDDARKGLLLSAIVGPLIGILCVIIGFYMRLEHPEIISSKALPLFIQYRMPSFLAGCLEGTLLLTLVGTTSGGLYASATIVYSSLMKKKFGNETLWTKVLILLFLVLVSSFGLGTMGDVILSWSFLGVGLRGAVCLFPLILVLYSRKTIRKTYVMASIIAAPLFTALGKLLLPSIDILPIFYGLLGSAFFLLLGFFTRKD